MQFCEPSLAGILHACNHLPAAGAVYPRHPSWINRLCPLRGLVLSLTRSRNTYHRQAVVPAQPWPASATSTAVRHRFPSRKPGTIRLGPRRLACSGLPTTGPVARAYSSGLPELLRLWRAQPLDRRRVWDKTQPVTREAGAAPVEFVRKDVAVSAAGVLECPDPGSKCTLTHRAWESLYNEDSPSIGGAILPKQPARLTLPQVDR